VTALAFAAGGTLLSVAAALALVVAVALVRDHHAAVEADSREPVGGERRS